MGLGQVPVSSSVSISNPGPSFCSVLLRYTIKGIHNLIFYGLPSFPHFYSEVCNMLAAGGQGEEASWTCTTIYSRYDAHKLAAITGTQRAGQMLHSSKTVHLFITGGDDKRSR